MRASQHVAMIETLPIRYATSYHELGTKVTLVKVTQGNLAQAIGRGVANPMIVTRFDQIAARYLDPGAHRVSAVPVRDASDLFPQTRLLAINATNRPAFYQRSIPCPVLEIRAYARPVDPQALRGQGPAFEQTIAAGFAATQLASEHVGIQAAALGVASDGSPTAD